MHCQPASGMLFFQYILAHLLDIHITLVNDCSKIVHNVCIDFKQSSQLIVYSLVRVWLKWIYIILLRYNTHKYCKETRCCKSSTSTFSIELLDNLLSKRTKQDKTKFNVTVFPPFFHQLRYNARKVRIGKREVVKALSFGFNETLNFLN